MDPSGTTRDRSRTASSSMRKEHRFSTSPSGGRLSARTLVSEAIGIAVKSYIEKAMKDSKTIKFNLVPCNIYIFAS